MSFSAVRHDVGIGIDDARGVPAVQELQVLHDIFLLQRAYNLTGLVVKLDTDGLDAACKSVIVVEESIPQRALIQLNRIEGLALRFLDLTDYGIQSLHGIDCGHIDIILLYIGVVNIVELGQGRILVCRNRVHLPVYLCTGPELLRNEAVKLRRHALHQVRDVLKSAKVHEFAVIRVVGEHQVEIFARIHDGVHLCVILIPCGDLHVQPYADLLLGVIADLGDVLLKIVCRRTAYRPVDQRGHFAAAALCLLAALCLRRLLRRLLG